MDLQSELARERRARLAAERLLTLRQQELHEANSKLGKHANALTTNLGEIKGGGYNLQEAVTIRKHEVLT